MTSRYSCWSRSDTECLFHLVQPRNEPVDVVRDRVEVEAGTSRRGHAETRHQRLRAVVARAHGDVLPIEDLRDVVRVDALELEADDAGPAVCGRAEHADPADLGERVHRLHDELVLMRLDRLETHVRDI